MNVTKFWNSRIFPALQLWLELNFSNFSDLMTICSRNYLKFFHKALKMIQEELLVARLMINQKLLHLEGIGLTNGSSLCVMTIKQSSSEKNNALSQIFFLLSSELVWAAFPPRFILPKYDWLVKYVTTLLFLNFRDMNRGKELWQKWASENKVGKMFNSLAI